MSYFGALFIMFITLMTLNKILIVYVLGTPLDFTTIYHYRNALNVFQGYQSVSFYVC